jgi:MFS family permease
MRSSDAGPRLCGVRTAAGVTLTHLVAFYLCSLLSITSLVAMDALQPYALQEIYGVAEDEIGRTTGRLALAYETWSLLWLALWGGLSERLGRRRVFAAGFILMAVAMLLVPAGTSVWAHLLPIRLLFAQGAAAASAMLTALLADYVRSEDRGAASGAQGLAAGAGALLAVFGLVRLPAFICLTNTYYAAGALSLAAAALAAALLAPPQAADAGSTATPSSCGAAAADARAALSDVWLAVKAGRRGVVALAYAAGFLARGNSTVLSLFLTAFTLRYYQRHDLCGQVVPGDYIVTHCGERFIDDQKLTCRDAYIRGSALSGVSQAVVLLAAPLVGYLADRRRGAPDLQQPLLQERLLTEQQQQRQQHLHSPTKHAAAASLHRTQAVCVSAAVGSVAFLSFALLDSPAANLALLPAAAAGVAEIAMIITAGVLVTHHSPAALRGPMAGVFSAAGGLGVLVASAAGGFLFDLAPAAPFVLFGGLSTLVLVAGVALLVSSPAAAAEGAAPNPTGVLCVLSTPPTRHQQQQHQQQQQYALRASA